MGREHCRAGVELQVTRMRGLRLYARSRRMVPVLTAMFAVGLVGALFAGRVLSVPSLNGNDERLVPLVLLVPLVCSVIAGTTLDSSMAELEAVAARELRTVRLLHCLTLVLVPVLAMVPSGFGGLGLTGHALALRNVIGYLGLTYLGAATLGARIAWVLPVTYAFLAATLAVTSSAAVPGWAWPVDATSDLASWVWAGATGLGGTLLLTWDGARRSGM